MGVTVMRALLKAWGALLSWTGLRVGPVTVRQDLERRVTTEVAEQPGLTLEEAIEALKNTKQLRSLEYDITKLAAETQAEVDQFLVDAAIAQKKILESENALKEEVIKGEILDQTHDQQVESGVLAADTKLNKQKVANIESQRALERANQEANESRAADAARHLSALGPTEEERQRAEQDRRDEAWARDLAADAAGMKYRLNKKGPFTTNDRYYAFAAVQFYAARIDGHDRSAAMAIAAKKLFDRKKRQQEIPDDEAGQFAERAHELYQALCRKEAADLKAAEARTREEQELETSRNNLQAAEKQHAAAEKLETIINRGKNDGAQFDPRA